MFKATILCLISALIAAIVLQGTMLHFFLAVLVTVLVIAPMLFILTVAGIIRRSRGIKMGSDYRRCATLIFFVAAFTLISYLMGCCIHDLRFSATRQYVASTIPALDNVKKCTGKYPAVLPAHSSEPFLQKLSYPLNYSSDGDTFRFEYWDPGGMMDGYQLNSSTRRWNYFD